MDVTDSGDESDDEHMSTQMLEEIHDGSKSHPSVNRRETRYKIRDHIKQRKLEQEGALLFTLNMGKGSHKLFKTSVNEILKVLPISGEYGSEDFYFIPDPRNFAKVNILSDNIEKPWIKETPDVDQKSNQQQD